MAYRQTVIGWAFAGLLATTAAPAWASGSADAAAAVETAAATLAPSQFVWNDTASDEPVSIVVNIAEQRAYVYRGQALVAASTVSTGRDGHETPAGTFTILQKHADHRSTIYDGAPMPFMQRLTWDGIAIHAGRNPGFPASHGCIRVPTAFAKKLFAVTTVGTTVTVVGADGLVPATPQATGETADETAQANLTQQPQEVATR